MNLIYRVDSDELKEMQIRTATSCLYATATFLNSLPAEHIENIESDLKSMLLTNSTYWKLNKHPTPSVCIAIYSDLLFFLILSFIFLFSLGSTSLVHFIVLYTIKITKIFTR